MKKETKKIENRVKRKSKERNREEQKIRMTERTKRQEILSAYIYIYEQISQIYLILFIQPFTYIL